MSECPLCQSVPCVAPVPTDKDVKAAELKDVGKTGFLKKKGGCGRTSPLRIPLGQGQGDLDNKVTLSAGLVSRIFLLQQLSHIWLRGT